MYSVFLFLFGAAMLCPGCVTAGYFSDELPKITERCCNQGTSYARNHTFKDCSSSNIPEVPSKFSSLCIFTMDQCCQEYFNKKQDCYTGIDVALSLQKCDDAKSESAKACCHDCLRGLEDHQSDCTEASAGTSSTDYLTNDAFNLCCKKRSQLDHEEKEANAQEDTFPDTKLETKPINFTSVCEEFAPNELCAHHCIPVPGSYRCECNPGFMLMADRRNCREVTKNRCKPHNRCQHKCNDNGREVKCSCRRGYQLKADKISCEDIDECLLDTPVCLPGTECHNIVGSYKCIPTKKPHPEVGQCPAGFYKNSKNNACDDINECSLTHPPCPKYLCENTIGGYRCGGVVGDPANLPPAPPIPVHPLEKLSDDRCPQGYNSGVNEECIDVDECTTGLDDCNRASQFCINTRGSFYCQDKVSKHCPPGFKSNSQTNKCEDIDECASQDSQSLCRPDQICINVPGAYDCRSKEDFSYRHNQCPDGMRRSITTGICEDIDECLEGTHLCDQYQTCLNTNTSHECHCKPGFKLDPTTGACEDVNECATGQNDCVSISQRCDNTVGSYVCIRFTSCGTGYVLHHSTGKCEDIDECALGTHNCNRAGPGYTCLNIAGSFRCIRKQTTTTLPPEEYEYVYEYETDSEETQGILEQSHVVGGSGSGVGVDLKKVDSSPVISSSNSTVSSMIPKLNESDPNKEEITPTEIIPLPSNTSKPDQNEDYRPKPEDIYTTDNSNKIVIPAANTSNSLPSVDDSRTPKTEDEAPHVVTIDVPKETELVRGDKKKDGSVVFDTKYVPKNKWTKIDIQPDNNCPSGFKPNNQGVCEDIDECATLSHMCSGLTEVCRNNIGGYICECAPGFRRDVTGACELIVTSTPRTTTITASITSSSTTAATTSTTTPVTTSSTTIATTSSSTTAKSMWLKGIVDRFHYRRQPLLRPFKSSLCDIGFHMNSLTGKCEDIDECVSGVDRCAAVEVCVNTQGGYRCECPPNWLLDNERHRCVPIRDKNHFPPGYRNQVPQGHSEVLPHREYGTDFVEPTLDNFEGSTVYKCPYGYRLGSDGVCADVDECSTGIANCGPLQICSNLPGGYTCSCPPGHKLVGDHECEDVDECALAGKQPICSQNADCINTVGSYQCRCHNGFRPAPVNDKVCTDIDECTEPRSGSLCQHRCNNVWGGYRCSCHRGYKLNPDNRTCSDVNECEEFKSKYKSKQLCIGKCVNEPGSYKCSCPQGYRLSQDKRSCIDIDECETGSAPCSKQSSDTKGTTCVNTRGGYRCEKISCPPGYVLENNHRCNKMLMPCSVTDRECLHQPSTISYNYITFVSNLYIPHDKVDLFTMKGPSWPNAKLKFKLSLIKVNAPPSVKVKASMNSFLLTQLDSSAIVSIKKSLEGPQSIDLELSMELYVNDAFSGVAVAKIFIFITEYEF